MYLANCVAQIRSKTKKEQWNYIGSSFNPADDGSRGMTTKQMLKNPRWITGPSFLCQPEDEWIKPILIEDVSLEDPEVQQSCFFVNVKETWSVAKAMKSFSTWQRARLAVANCLIYRSKLLKRVKLNQFTTRDNESNDNKSTVTVEIFRKAELEIYRSVQLAQFEKEVQMLKLDKGNKNERYGKDFPNAIHVVKSSSLYPLKPFCDDLGI